jgi:hypothetical protein
MGAAFMLIRYLLLVAGLSLALPLSGQTPSEIAKLPVTSREQMIATAKQLADFTWMCPARNLKASCIPNYQSDWKEDQRITGLPYNWGGIDSPEEFQQKLQKGLAAGSHSRYGVTNCTAGIDCSGFVSFCWGLRSHKYTTGNIRQIAGRPKYNWFTDMKPGDALDKAGDHIVLFAGYNPDGTINIYEASGSASRVIFHKTTWSRLKGYVPLQYKMIADEQ